MTDFFKIEDATNTPESLSQALNFALLRNNRAARERRLPGCGSGQLGEDLNSRTRTSPDQWWTHPPRLVFLTRKAKTVRVRFSMTVFGTDMLIGAKLVPIQQVGIRARAPDVTKTAPVGTAFHDLDVPTNGNFGWCAIFPCFQSKVVPGTEVVLENPDGASTELELYVLDASVSRHMRLLIDPGQVLPVGVFAKAMIVRGAVDDLGKWIAGPPGDTTELTGQQPNLPGLGQWMLIISTTNDGVDPGGTAIIQHVWTWRPPGVVGYQSGSSSNQWMFDRPVYVTVADISEASVTGIWVSVIEEEDPLPFERQRYEVNQATRGLSHRGIYGEQHQTFVDLGRWHAINSVANNNFAPLNILPLQDPRFTMVPYDPGQPVRVAAAPVGEPDPFEWQGADEETPSSYTRGLYRGVALLGVGWYGHTQADISFQLNAQAILSAPAQPGLNIGSSPQAIRLQGTPYAIPNNTDQTGLGYLFLWFREQVYSLAPNPSFNRIDILNSRDSQWPTQGQQPDPHNGRGMFPLDQMNQINWQVISFEIKDTESKLQPDPHALRAISLFITGDEETADGNELPLYRGEPWYILGGFGVVSGGEQNPAAMGVANASPVTGEIKLRGGRANRGGDAYLLAKKIKEQEPQLQADNGLAMITQLDRRQLMAAYLLELFNVPAATPDYRVGPRASVILSENVKLITLAFYGAQITATLQAWQSSGGLTVSASGGGAPANTYYVTLDISSLGTQEIDIEVRVVSVDGINDLSLRGWRVLEEPVDTADIP